MSLNVGPQLRAVRLAKGKSLRSVASAIGISPSLLSQVENSKSSPSVRTLYALVSYLGVTMDVITSPEPYLGNELEQKSSRKSNSVVQRRHDNQKLEMQNGVIWERLADAASPLVDPLLVTYEPGAGSSLDGEPMQHNAAEFGMLLEGELSLLLDGKMHTLKAGDSFSFDANLPHRYLNATQSVARGVWFVVSKNQENKPSMPERSHGNGPASAVEVLALMGNARL